MAPMAEDGGGKCTRRLRSLEFGDGYGGKG